MKQPHYFYTKHNRSVFLPERRGQECGPPADIETPGTSQPSRSDEEKTARDGGSDGISPSKI